MESWQWVGTLLQCYRSLSLIVVYDCDSLALLVEPLAVGTLREAYGSFTSSVWVFTALTTLGAALALWVMLHDQVSGWACG